MKALIEKRNTLVEEMEALLNTAKTEARAFNEEETGKIEAIKVQVSDIDKTIKLEEEVRAMVLLTSSNDRILTASAVQMLTDIVTAIPYK